MDGLIWATFYAGLVSIRMHPKNTEIPDLEQLANIADAMMVYYIERYPICHGSE